MAMCALSPVVLLAAAVGMTVTSLTGSVAAGWLAGAAVAALSYLVARRRSLGACGVAPGRARPFEGLDTGTAGGDHGATVGRPDEAVRQP